MSRNVPLCARKKRDANCPAVAAISLTPDVNAETQRPQRSDLRLCSCLRGLRVSAFTFSFLPAPLHRFCGRALFIRGRIGIMQDSSPVDRARLLFTVRASAPV